MNGSGCKACPVKPCQTMQYRGSTCAAQRAKLGLGDPKTIADKIRGMSDEEMAAYLADHYDNFCQNKPECGTLLDTDECIPEELCVACALEWLQSPAGETPRPVCPCEDKQESGLPLEVSKEEFHRMNAGDYPPGTAVIVRNYYGRD